MKPNLPPLGCIPKEMYNLHFLQRGHWVEDWGVNSGNSHCGGLLAYIRSREKYRSIVLFLYYAYLLLVSE